MVFTCKLEAKLQQGTQSHPSFRKEVTIKRCGAAWKELPALRMARSWA